MHGEEHVVIVSIYKKVGLLLYFKVQTTVNCNGDFSMSGILILIHDLKCTRSKKFCEACRTLVIVQKISKT